MLYAKLEGFEFKDKASITSSEVVAYLKAVLCENGLFSFGQDRERTGKLISKLHRYLSTNLAAYKEKCSGEIKDYQPKEVAAEASQETLLATSECLSSWVDFQGRKSQMFYILGPLDEATFKVEEEEQQKQAEDGADEKKADPNAPAPLTPEQIAERHAENARVHFGRVEADPVALSELHQDVRDLANKMTASEKLSEAQNERDRKGYQKTFEEIVDRLGGFYKPPILSEEEAGKEVDCLKLVAHCIPPLSVENVNKLAEILKMETGCSTIDPHYNAILRHFHRIRFAK